MNTKIFLMVLVALMVGCQGFDFVYDKSPTIKLLENRTQIIALGDDTKSQLNSFIGTSVNNGVFSLLITSVKTSKNVVIKNDQTVSQIEIKHILNYSLQKSDGGCIISEATISSNSTYNLKSSGYSFGTDLAKKETTQNNIEKNINDFFRFLNNNHSNLDCNNEA